MLSGNTADGFDDAPLTLRNGLLAALQSHSLLQDLQPISHRLEGAALRRRHTVDDVLLPAQDGVATEALVERPTNGDEFLGDALIEQTHGGFELALLLLLHHQLPQRILSLLR